MITLLVAGLLIWLFFFHLPTAIILGVAAIAGFVIYRALDFIFKFKTFSAINFGLGLVGIIGVLLIIIVFVA